MRNRNTHNGKAILKGKWMGRVIGLFLLICLTVSSALADDRAPIRLGDNISVSSFWKDNGIPTAECLFQPSPMDRTS